MSEALAWLRKQDDVHTLRIQFTPHYGSCYSRKNEDRLTLNVLDEDFHYSTCVPNHHIEHIIPELLKDCISTGRCVQLFMNYDDEDDGI